MPEFEPNQNKARLNRFKHGVGFNEFIQLTAEQIAVLKAVGLTDDQIAALPRVRGWTDEQILLALNIGAVAEGKETTQAEFDALTDEEIDFSDAPEWTDEDWRK